MSFRAKMTSFFAKMTSVSANVREVGGGGEGLKLETVGGKEGRV